MSSPVICHRCPLLIAALLMIPVPASSQGTAAPAKAAAPQASSSGFSIETEMLTYRALESNSQAISCDVAGVIGGGKPDFLHPQDGAGCAAPANAAETTVVLLPFEKTEIESFSAWRLAMVELSELQDKAAMLGCPKDPNKSPATRAGTSTSALSSFLSMSPAGPPLAMASTVLGLLASEETSTSVGGTIQDLAFINNIARQLKALHISVVTPSSYDPGGLTSAEKSGPFLASKQRTLLMRGCLTTLKPPNQADASTVQQVIAEIDDYMAALVGEKIVRTPAPVADGVAGAKRGSDPGNNPGAAAPSPGTSAAANAAPAQALAAPAPTPPASSTTTTSTTTNGAAGVLSAILQADGLALKLGFRFNVETGRLTQPSTGRYILMIKALESGGSVTGKSNILGTRLRYSGGSVGTYALFSADGELACSGNVYDYAGSLSSKHFDRDLRKLTFNPHDQVIFHAGGCPALGEIAPAAIPASNDPK